MENLFFPVLLIAFIVLWIWAILDLSFSTFTKSKWKMAWLLVITFFPLVGSILYLLLKGDFKTGKKKFAPQFRHQEGNEIY